MYISVPDVFFVPVYYAEKDLVIGVSFPTQREYKWVRDKAAMENYAKEKGVTLKIENADTDVAKQASQVENLISQGIDILILAPTDSVATAPLVEKAHKAGIKVIAYDRSIYAIDLDLYIAFNNIRIGELQGRFLVHSVPKGNYIIMSGDPKDDISRFMKEGAMEYIQPLVATGDIKIVADKAVDNWEPKNAFKIVKDALIANKNKIDAILAPNDATAGAAIQALAAQGLAGKVVVTGMDGDLSAIQRIVQGTQSMTVLKDSRELSRTAIDSAIKLASGAGIDINGTVTNVSSIILTPIAIDKTNVDKVIIDSGYYKEEEVYKR